MNVYPGFRRLSPVGVVPLHARAPAGGPICYTPGAQDTTTDFAVVSCDLCRKILNRTAEGRKALRVDRRPGGAGRSPKQRGAY
jgi:hypothetical protein